MALCKQVKNGHHINYVMTSLSVSSGYPNTWKRVFFFFFYDVRRSIFDEIRDVWTADETLSGVFDLSSHSKQKLRSKRRSKIVKIYANYDRVSKPQSRLWFPLF